MKITIRDHFNDPKEIDKEKWIRVDIGLNKYIEILFKNENNEKFITIRTSGGKHSMGIRPIAGNMVEVRAK